MEIFAEHALHDFLLARPEKPIVYENAGKLIANRLVQKRGRDRRIDATAQTEHDFFMADLIANTFTSLLNE